MSHHDKSFPGESAQYRKARNELLQSEIDLRQRIEDVAAKRRALPPGPPIKEDYPFTDATGATVRVSELFAPGKNALVLYSFMYGPEMENPCPMCTSIIDGFNSQAPHVTDRVNMAVVAKSPIKRILEFAATRGWTSIRLLSSEGTTYNVDYWGEDGKGAQWPMVNVFVKNGAEVRHFWGSELFYAKIEGHPRHADLLWPLWNLFDLTPDGRGTDWWPKLDYR